MDASVFFPTQAPVVIAPASVLPLVWMPASFEAEGDEGGDDLLPGHRLVLLDLVCVLLAHLPISRRLSELLHELCSCIPQHVRARVTGLEPDLGLRDSHIRHVGVEEVDLHLISARCAVRREERTALLSEHAPHLLAPLVGDAIIGDLLKERGHVDLLVHI